MIKTEALEILASMFEARGSADHTARHLRSGQKMLVELDDVLQAMALAATADDGWIRIEMAPNSVERCFLWCVDMFYEDESEDPAPRGTVFGRINNGIARGEGMSGNWTFTHYRPLFDAPEAS